MVQAAPATAQLVVGAPQLPLAQLPEQHWPAVVQIAPSAAHGVLQVFDAGSQTPAQQSLFCVQAALGPRQVLAPKPQRGGSTDLSQAFEQQPEPGPESQVSPVGRQSLLVRSIWHCPPWQMFEQQSALAVQVSLSVLQILPPHTPPLQAREQQSSAFAHAAPSAVQ